MKKIQFFARELGFTGLTRELVTLVNSLSNLYNVELVFINESATTPYTLSKKVTVKYLNDSKLFFIINDKIKNVIKDYNPNIIISTDLSINKYIVKNTTATTIYWDHTNTSEDIKIKKIIRNTKKINKVVFASNQVYLDTKDKINCSSLYIPDGINIDINNLSDLQTKNIVFVGKLTENKCLDDLLEVMSLVRKEDKEVNLSIVGDGVLRSYIVDKAKKLRLGLSISILGSISEEEKKDVLVDSSIFVSTSNSNSFGMSVLEAMSMGIPAIVYEETINNKEIIENDINGYIIKNHDKVDMKNKILYLINNDEIRKDFGSCARETSMAYDINNLKSEWIKILK